MQNPIDTTSPQTGAAQPSRARRKLLLGATGALPSVLTLSSGAQAAIASNLRCLTPPQQMPTRFLPQDDNWVRAQVHVGELHGRPAYCVAAQQDGCLDPMVPNHAAPGTPWIVDGQQMTAGMDTDLHVADDRAYGLVYVDRGGSITALDSRAGIGLQPVTDSCWVSVLGGRTSRLG